MTNTTFTSQILRNAKSVDAYQSTVNLGLDIASAIPANHKWESGS